MQRKKRKIEQAEESEKKPRITLYCELTTQNAKIRARETQVLEALSVDGKSWNDFVIFCSRYMFYMRHQHSDFHACMKKSLEENGIVLKRRSKKKGNSIRCSNFSNNTDEALWVHVFIYSDGIKSFKIYKMLTTEFYLVFQSLFTSQNSWMNCHCPENMIPTGLLRGCLRFFTERVSDWFPTLHPLSLSLSPFFHQSVDVFAMVRDYGHLENSTLAKSMLEQHNQMMEERYQKEEDYEFRDQLRSHCPSETSQRESVLSEISSMFSSSTVDEDGNVRERTESEKVYSKFFYMKMPDERVIYPSKKVTPVHPYDLGLYVFVEAKKLSGNGKTICENYKAIVDGIRGLDEPSHNGIFGMLKSVKDYIFGQPDDEFNMAHIIMAENISSVACHRNRATRLEYVAVASGDDMVLRFDRMQSRVLDVMLAFEYLNVRYKRLFKVSVSEGITWDDSYIYFRLPSVQHRVLVESVVFFESFKYRPENPVPLYPIVAQRYLLGCAAEKEQAVNSLLRMIRETRLRHSQINRWVSLSSTDDSDYLLLLPKILCRYETYSCIWQSLTVPFRYVMHQKYGPSERWLKNQMRTEQNAARYIDKENHGRRGKLNYNLTGFNHDAKNIYVGLESFFAVRSRHMINFDTLQQLYKTVGSAQWFAQDYPKLCSMIESLISGTIIENIQIYSDQDWVRIPFGLNRESDFLHMSEEHCIWDYVHVQLIKLCADPRLDNETAVDVFECMAMRNDRMEGGNVKKIPTSNNHTMLHQMNEVREKVSGQLLEETWFKEEDDDVHTPEDFFIFTVESLERLSFYHTVKRPDDQEYRGNQKNVPTGPERWLPFDNSVICYGENRLQKIPVYYLGDSPVYSDRFVPTIWTLAHRFTGSQTLIRSKKNLKISSFMMADPDLLNCLLCYPITTL